MLWIVRRCGWWFLRALSALTLGVSTLLSCRHSSCLPPPRKGEPERSWSRDCCCQGESHHQPQPAAFSSTTPFTVVSHLPLAHNHQPHPSHTRLQICIPQHSPCSGPLPVCPLSAQNRNVTCQILYASKYCLWQEGALLSSLIPRLLELWSWMSL